MTHLLILDLCANLECSGLGSNRCVDGNCVCGSSGGTCPDTMPVCFGEGATATCVCYPGSCQEPNPVCDPTDGTCKVGVILVYYCKYQRRLVLVGNRNLYI